MNYPNYRFKNRDGPDYCGKWEYKSEITIFTVIQTAYRPPLFSPFKRLIPIHATDAANRMYPPALQPTCPLYKSISQRTAPNSTITGGVI